MLRSLASIGVGPEEVRAMVSSSLAFLISPSASAGVRAAVDCLLANGFSTEEVRRCYLIHTLTKSVQYMFHACSFKLAHLL